jgi:hypothetical protein
MHAFYPHGACWWWAFNSPALVGIIWTTRKLREKCKCFLLLGKIFMGPGDHDEIPSCKIMYSVRGMGATGGISDGNAQ